MKNILDSDQAKVSFDHIFKSAEIQAQMRKSYDDCTYSDLKHVRKLVLKEVEELLKRGRDETREYTAQEESAIDYAMALCDHWARLIQLGTRSGADDDDIMRRSGKEGSGDSLAGRGARWTTPDGKTVRVYRPNERISRDTDANPELEKLGFGGFIRSMITGAKTDLEQRALSEGSDGAGGYTVPDILSSQLIDRLRANSVLNRAGARTVKLETDTTKIARLATDPTASWRVENALQAASNPTFEAVVFTARTLLSLVVVSRELMDDSLNINDALMNAFAKSMALELDRVGIDGSGVAPEPKGIANTSGIGSVLSSSGKALTDYGYFLDALCTLRVANSREPTAAIMAPQTAKQLGKLVDGMSQPLRRPPEIENLPFLITNSVPLTSGSPSDQTYVLMGDFTQALIGMRTDIRIEVLKERYADYFQYGFLCYLRADIQLAQPPAFVKIDNIGAHT